MEKRADVLLVEKGLAASRERAKELIQKGQVFCEGKPVKKTAEKLDEEKSLEVRGEVLPYVSRGGLKLEKAMKTWELPLSGVVCMDVGASTGGFTDCMLQNGAKKVYAIDVGSDQLSEKLKADQRVVNMEKTNIRVMTRDDFPDEIDFCSIDVSFISLTLVLPVVAGILKEGGECVALIKPQFEAGRENIGKKGVVKDRKVHEEVVKSTVLSAESYGFTVKGLSFSPIKGPEGNIEYLIYLQNSKAEKAWSGNIRELISASHTAL